MAQLKASPEIVELMKQQAAKINELRAAIKAIRPAMEYAASSVVPGLGADQCIQAAIKKLIEAEKL